MVLVAMRAAPAGAQSALGTAVPSSSTGRRRRSPWTWLPAQVSPPCCSKSGAVRGAAALAELRPRQRQPLLDRSAGFRDGPADSGKPGWVQLPILRPELFSSGEGGNQITLRFTDLAGNTTTQTFSRTVQAGALTAAITWPPDQTLICRDTFVVTGTERPGSGHFRHRHGARWQRCHAAGMGAPRPKFYIPDVPLSGTQATISAVASTETAVSSPALVSVARAGYNLHEVVVGDLRRLEVLTTACIQKTDSSLPSIPTATVNGRSVTVVQGGVPGCEQSWQECVPMDLGSAFFLLRARATRSAATPRSR